MIDLLFSVGAEVWRRFLEGEPYFSPSSSISTLLDELCDGVGGGNMLLIDCGGPWWIAMPCPAQVRESAVLCMLVAHPEESRDLPAHALWEVGSWSTQYAPGVQDEPLLLARHMSTFIADTLGSTTTKPNPGGFHG